MILRSVVSGLHGTPNRSLGTTAASLGHETNVDYTGTRKRFPILGFRVARPHLHRMFRRCLPSLMLQPEYFRHNEPFRQKTISRTRQRELMEISGQCGSDIAQKNAMFWVTKAYDARRIGEKSLANQSDIKTQKCSHHGL